MLEGPFQVLAMKAWGTRKGAIGKKAAISDYGVQVGVEILKITVCLYGNAGSGDCFFMKNRGF